MSQINDITEALKTIVTTIHGNERQTKLFSLWFQTKVGLSHATGKYESNPSTGNAASLRCWTSLEAKAKALLLETK